MTDRKAVAYAIAGAIPSPIAQPIAKPSHRHRKDRETYRTNYSCLVHDSRKLTREAAE